MVIKQARKRDLLTQLLQDGGAGKFKAIAEAHGLTCVLCGQYEWNTMPGGNLVEYALSKGWNEIRIGRSSLPPVLPLRSCGDGPGRGGDVGKGLPCGAGRDRQATASAWDKSVTFFFISAASCAFASLASGPLGGGCPCWPFRKRQKMLCGVCISPHSISVCNTAAKTLLPEWGRKGYNNSVVRIFRCMGGRVTHIGPQALATPGIRRNISVPLGSYITQSEQN